MTDSRESDRRTFAIPMRVRQESDARHQEKFDCDSPLSRIHSEVGVDAERAFRGALRRREAGRRRLAAVRDARAIILGDAWKTALLKRRPARARAAAERLATALRRSGERRRHPLRLAFVERRAERTLVR